jgi:branched-subunit amino acid aminotransferase/4-amino-4-deoxychorismate lyase
MTDDSYISLNGSLTKSNEASVTPINRAMMYGDGCFETLKSYHGRFLAWDEHYIRLIGGLSYLELESPVNSDELKMEVIELLHANNLKHEEAMVRIQFWREGGRGYNTSSHKTSRMVHASSYDSPKGPLDLITAKTRCIPSESLERKYKLTNGLNYIKASQEAVKHRKDDALMLTVAGYVSETTISNVFWFKDGKFFTPSLECDLLPGITRSIVLRIIEENGFEVELGEFEPDSIYDSDAAFCTNSLIEIREIRSIDETHFKTGLEPIIKIRDSFISYKLDALKV